MVRNITKAKRHRPRTAARSFAWRRSAKIFGVAAFFASVLTGVYYGTRVETFQVRTVLVQGGTTISPMAIRSVVEEVLDGSYFGLVPHRFAYQVPREEIERRLREVPRLAQVRITQPHRTELAIEFEEYQPRALWCGGAHECMFIDTVGFAFAEAPASLLGSLYPRITVSSSSPKYAAYVPSQVSLPDMLTLRAVFARYGLSLLEVRYVDDYDVWYLFTQGSVLKTRRAEPADMVIKRLEELFATTQYASLPKDGFKSIDLRFGNRVYVRDKNAQGEVPEDAAVASTTAVQAEPLD